MTAGNVRAIQKGLKTNTRRVCFARTQDQADIIGGAIMEDIYDSDTGAHELEAWRKRIKCPYGKDGDQIALKETFWCWGRWEMGVSPETKRVTAKWINLTDSAHPLLYAADKPQLQKIGRTLVGYHKRPSIYLPKTAWRIVLEITRVEVERLQDISEADAIAEGVEREGKGWKSYETILTGRYKGQKHPHSVVPNKSPVTSYREIWESINSNSAPGKPDISWKANPFVHSIHFKKLS